MYLSLRRHLALVKDIEDMREVVCFYSAPLSRMLMTSIPAPDGSASSLKPKRLCNLRIRIKRPSEVIRAASRGYGLQVASTVEVFGLVHKGPSPLVASGKLIIAKGQPGVRH